MKLIKFLNGRFIFALGWQETYVMRLLFRQYPLIPAAYQRLSKASLPSPEQVESNQQLLEEALAEQRRENKQNLEDLLTDERRFRDTGEGGRLILTAAEIEWLLQILNDVIVGSWIQLGSPEQSPRTIKVDQATVGPIRTLDLAQVFQAGLLSAVYSDGAD